MKVLLVVKYQRTNCKQGIVSRLFSLTEKKGHSIFIFKTFE